MHFLKSKLLLFGILSFLAAGLFTYDVSKLPSIRFLKFDVSSEHSIEIQIFYDTGAGFNQKQSSVRQIKSNGRFITVRSPTIEKKTRRVRVDFLTDTKKIRFRNFCITNRHNEEIKRFKLPSIHKFINIATHAVDNDILSIAYTGNDPQIVFDQHVLHFGQHFYWPLFVALVFVINFALNTTNNLLAKCYYMVRKIDRTSVPAATKPSLLIGNVFWLSNAIGLTILLLGTYWIIIHPRNFLVKVPAPKTNIRFTPKRSPEILSFRRPDGLKISATAFDSEKRNRKLPAILLLHGKYPLGSRFPMYPVLSEKLVDLGYYVLALDFGGYGRSGNPLSMGVPSALDMNIETRMAIDHLTADQRFEQTGVAIVSHSMGGGPALAVAEQTSSVRSIILIGPPRRVFERFHFPPDLKFFWDWQHHVSRKLYGHANFPAWYTKEFWRQDIIERDMVNHLPFTSSRHHPPILLIDGEKEPKADRKFMQWYYCRSSQPKKLITLQRTNHPCNVFLDGHNVIYDGPVMETLVDQIDSWITTRDKPFQKMTDNLNQFLDWLFAHHLILCRAYEEITLSPT